MAYYVILCWDDRAGQYFMSELAFSTRAKAEEHAEVLMRGVDVTRTDIFCVLPLREK